MIRRKPNLEAWLEIEVLLVHASGSNPFATRERLDLRFRNTLSFVCLAGTHKPGSVQTSHPIAGADSCAVFLSRKGVKARSYCIVSQEKLDGVHEFALAILPNADEKPEALLLGVSSQRISNRTL